MKIHFLKEDALIALKSNVHANLANYKKPTNQWIYDYFQGEDPFIEANFECEDFQLINRSSMEEISKLDIQNVKILYTALRSLSDTQATDERLWAGLCHDDFWDYTLKRWNATQDASLILNRYFFSKSNGKKRSLSLNTLSKLWWIGRLTYNPNRTDPFELLKYFETDFSEKLLLLFSNNFMSNLEITSALIESLLELNSIGFTLTADLNPHNNREKEIYLRATGYLNVFGGTHILDCFSKEEIKKRILDHMLWHCQIKFATLFSASHVRLPVCRVI